MRTQGVFAFKGASLAALIATSMLSILGFIWPFLISEKQGHPQWIFLLAAPFALLLLFTSVSNNHLDSKSIALLAVLARLGTLAAIVRDELVLVRFARGEVAEQRLARFGQIALQVLVDGVPLLEAGFNHLTDLEKIAGGSAESFLKNSSRTLVFKFDANSAPTLLSNNPEGTQSTRPLSEVLEEKSQALNTSIDASVATAGGEVTTLQTTVADPGPSFEVAANLFAASVQRLVSVAASVVFAHEYHSVVTLGVGSPVTVAADVLPVKVEPMATVPEMVGSPAIAGAEGIAIAALSAEAAEVA